MSNYEPRLCIGCGAPLDVDARKCNYCRTSYEYVGPRLPEPHYGFFDPDYRVMGDYNTIPKYQTVIITNGTYTDSTNLTRGEMFYVTR